MSLIFLAVDFPPARGGIQKVAFELPRALHLAGEEVGVLSVCAPGSEEFDRQCPYPVARVPAGDKAQVATNLSAGVVELFEQFTTPPQAIIATKWFPEGLSAISARRLLRCPAVVIGHGREFRLTGLNPLKWLMQKYIMLQVDMALGVSEWTAGQLRRCGVRRDRVHVIHNGIRPKPFETPIDTSALREELRISDEPVLLTVGRLVLRKGQADVIRLLGPIMQQVGPVTYVIAGAGPQEQLLRDTADSCGVQEHVRFAGEVDDALLPAYYQLCDVFVMPTRDVPGDPLEGFGLVYLEANAAGKPVVGTDCGGVADAIEDDVSGLLVPRDDDGALVHAVSRLLLDGTLAQRLGQEGQQRVRDRFTWDRVARRFMDAIGELPQPATAAGTAH